jgi:hypothetical protein
MIFGAVCPNGGFREHLASGHTVQGIFVRVDLAISHSSPRMAFPEIFLARPGLTLSPYNLYPQDNLSREHPVLKSHRAANRSNKRCILAGEGCRHNQRPTFSP